MDLQSSLPIIIVLGVAGFLLGNMFALKPKARDVRTADFRLLARKFGFNPKLITRPDWLPARQINATNHAPKHDFVASYAVVDDDWRLPLLRLIVKDGTWQAVDTDGQVLADLTNMPNVPNNDVPNITLPNITLPNAIAPHAIALQARANGVVLYWQDGRYQADRGVQKLDKATAEADLTALKADLTAFANQLNQARST